MPLLFNVHKVTRQTSLTRPDGPALQNHKIHNTIKEWYQKIFTSVLQSSNALFNKLWFSSSINSVCTSFRLGLMILSFCSKSLLVFDIAYITNLLLAKTLLHLRDNTTPQKAYSGLLPLYVLAIVNLLSTTIHKLCLYKYAVARVLAGSAYVSREG